MSFVRTVLGDLPASELGVSYAHEHLIIDPSLATENEPDFLIDSVDRAVAELAIFTAAGGRAVVDSMPMACGRNVLKLADVSRRSGVHIVVPTGLHLPKYYPIGHWSESIEAEPLAQRFIQEIEQDIEGSPHRAGVIKVAGGRDRLNERERRAFISAAKAQRATGCPILTHTEEGTAALEQIALLAAHGADLSHVVLSHTDRKPEVEYHRQILRTGVRVEYDSCFRWKQGNPTLDLLVALLPEFPDQIMLGMDAARRKYWKSYGGSPGLDFLLTGFSKSLRDAGIEGDMLSRIFVLTPAQAYSFIKRSMQ